ncbi:MAG: hypothetical protein WD355_03150 [Balneolaceae bacterium]
MELEKSDSVTESEFRQEVISTGDWLLTLIIAAIPLIGFIMLFVWGFGGGANRNKANWAKASLLMLVLAIVIYGLIMLIFGTFFIFGSETYA